MSGVQSDLFELPHLAGLAQEEGIVAPREEHSLIASIDAAELSPFRFHGWSGKRLTASYGWSYDFDTARFAPTGPIPAWLLPLRAKAARFAHSAAEDLVQALLIRSIWAPGSAGIVIVRCSSMLSASRSVPPRRCDSAGAGGGSIAPPPSWLPDRFTI